MPLLLPLMPGLPNAAPATRYVMHLGDCGAARQTRTFPVLGVPSKISAVALHQKWVSTQ
jgi:hypothetical protein